ncbi:hypothetical protein R3P38DRAFT_2768563 [Favolaschia claudopus]|uniref:Uncharacterized protein n=1 Tax=Favolaschia claudopus TaxID=2862362 RepID=A0AAW0CN27_9AGAR
MAQEARPSTQTAAATCQMDILAILSENESYHMLSVVILALTMAHFHLKHMKHTQTHPTTPPHQPQHSSSSPATTPNQNHKRGRRVATSVTDVAPKRRGGHLAECKEIVEHWATEVYERDWAGKGFTSDVFITDAMITYLAHNRFSSLVHLRESLQTSTRSWGLVDDYGDEILCRLGRVDQRRDDERYRQEAERLQRQMELQEKRDRKEREAKAREAAPAVRVQQRQLRIEAEVIEKQRKADARELQRQNRIQKDYLEACRKYINYLNRPIKRGARPKVYSAP